jgi:hypothetical protein
VSTPVDLSQVPDFKGQYDEDLVPDLVLDAVLPRSDPVGDLVLL